MQITLDEGYQFGLGVFETIAVENGNPELLEWHLERLYGSLKEFGIEQTVTRTEIFAYLNTHKEATHEALKIMVSDCNKVFTMRRNPYTENKRERGFDLEYSGICRNETSPLVRHKTMNYGDCIVEKRRATKLGVDEFIFLNSKGEICEGTTTNIFFVKGKNLFTPPVSCGLLPGIMRRYVIENENVIERVLRKEDIEEMDACFVTNSLMGVMPVNRLGEKRFSCRCAVKGL